MKLKIVAVFTGFALLFCCGISVAYYNTRTYAFDENAKIISSDDEKLKILDFEIYYNSFDKTLENVRKFVPEKHLTVSTCNI